MHNGKIVQRKLICCPVPNLPIVEAAQVGNAYNEQAARLEYVLPGSTDAERMDNAVRKMFSVSKTEILKRDRMETSASAQEPKAAQISVRWPEPRRNRTLGRLNV